MNRMQRFLNRVAKKAIVTTLPKPRRFAVITRGRTGSHFLLSLLTSHPAIGDRGEVIGETLLRETNLKGTLDEPGPARYLGRCFARKSWKEQVVGIKFNYYQLEKDYARKWGISKLAEVSEFLKANPGIKIIHLKRRNRLRTVVSMRIAKQTKQYVLNDTGERVDASAIRLSPDELRKEVELIDRWERRYDSFFRDHDTIDVYYEDLVARRDSECNRLLDFLGVSHRELHTPMLKQNTKRLQDLIENYAHLKGHFTDSEWQRIADTS